ncbi:MAG: two-component system OmpR family response regulator [Gammaproteobacteria bacterium]|jgi:two-component system OmpR family response regulator
MTRILLIDDDEKLAAPLAEYFARFDMTLESESHPQRGLQR